MTPKVGQGRRTDASDPCPPRPQESLDAAHSGSGVRADLIVLLEDIVAPLIAADDVAVPLCDPEFHVVVPVDDVFFE